MYISSIKIKNYRGVKSDQLETSPFTCIIGENNAGKSTILLATSLFFSGTSLSKSDFYDEEESIEIELTFSGIDEKDINRLSPDHRARIKEILEGDKLILTRLYSTSTDGKSELRCSRWAPKDPRFEKDVVGGILKGKKGKEISESIISLFPEFGDKLSNVKTQKDVYEKLEEIISNMQSENLELKLSPLPTGIDNSIKSLLPEPIYIAAVKDLKDDVKSKESATFGKLLSILMRFLENSEHFDKITDSFNELHKLLNVVREAELITDNRIEKLQDIERQIGSFLSENFPKSKIEIEIPKPELKQVFTNARILIDDGVRDIIETKGDGIKRAVTFALLRTYVEQYKEQKREAAETKLAGAVEGSMAEVAPVEASEQPYIFLFEEPELYLHPSAQKILFEALEKLTEANNQVFVTTHSPMFFSPHSTGTFVKVIKEYPVQGKPYGKFLTVNLLKEIGAKDAFQIICYENNTAAFFANKVLLVEGDSDVIYMKEVAKLLNSEWNFDAKNIPIISINGKSNIKRFIDFYSFFQIKCFCIVDSDALIDGFEKFVVSDEIKKQREQLLGTLDKIAHEQGGQVDLPATKIKELVRRYTWKERYNKLKELGLKVKAGNALTEEETLEIDFLFIEEENNLRRRVFTDKAIEIPEKSSLLAELRNQDIFILSHGAIESYYPDGVTGDDKPTKALNAIKILKGYEDCRPHLPNITLEDQEHCELEVIFKRIFE
ncbi:AAA family ATPase [Parapedobacter indicus]|uniref:AAA ATPase domain-containing protein n=1 Tax=Parapedobacter indicus TaxID=1477437 RepID=A0A1I3IT39_9SPHI|nr:AAA family ATPase [Parapedobacter indicus]PPL02282.1 AAA ATPase-like protein [Parapedobacter indicus]SFI51116.1 AAA ATPase domain-containing protein [Parapedobacter indicus]